MKHNHHILLKLSRLTAVVAVLFLLVFVVGCDDDDDATTVPPDVVTDIVVVDEPVTPEVPDVVVSDPEPDLGELEEIEPPDDVPVIPVEAQILNAALSSDTVLEGGSVELSLSRSELEADEGEMEVTVQLPEGLKFAGEMRQAHVVFETGVTHKKLTLNADQIADPALHQRIITIDGSHISSGIDLVPKSMELTVVNYNVITARLSTSKTISGEEVTVYLEASRLVESDITVLLDAMGIFTTSSPFITLPSGERMASAEFTVSSVDQDTNVIITLRTEQNVPPVYKSDFEPLGLAVTQLPDSDETEEEVTEENDNGGGGREVDPPPPPPPLPLPLPPAVDDHGDTPATATPISIGSSLGGKLTLKSGGGQDLDYFRVEVLETMGSNLEFHTSGSANTFGRLLTADGTSVIANDGGMDRNFRISRDLAPGTYYIEVSPGATGDYTFHVSEARALQFGRRSISPSLSTDLIFGGESATLTLNISYDSRPVAPTTFIITLEAPAGVLTTDSARTRRIRVENAEDLRNLRLTFGTNRLPQAGPANDVTIRVTTDNNVNYQVPVDPLTLRVLNNGFAEIVPQLSGNVVGFGEPAELSFTAPFASTREVEVEVYANDPDDLIDGLSSPFVISIGAGETTAARTFRTRAASPGETASEVTFSFIPPEPTQSGYLAVANPFSLRLTAVAENAVFASLSETSVEEGESVTLVLSSQFPVTEATGLTVTIDDPDSVLKAGTALKRTLVLGVGKTEVSLELETANDEIPGVTSTVTISIASAQAAAVLAFQVLDSDPPILFAQLSPTTINEGENTTLTIRSPIIEPASIDVAVLVYDVLGIADIYYAVIETGTQFVEVELNLGDDDLPGPDSDYDIRLSSSGYRILPPSLVLSVTDDDEGLVASFDPSTVEIGQRTELKFSSVAPLAEGTTLTVSLNDPGSLLEMGTLLTQTIPLARGETTAVLSLTLRNDVDLDAVGSITIGTVSSNSLVPVLPGTSTLLVHGSSTLNRGFQQVAQIETVTVEGGPMEIAVGEFLVFLAYDRTAEQQEYTTRYLVESGYDVVAIDEDLGILQVRTVEIMSRTVLPLELLFLPAVIDVDYNVLTSIAIHTPPRETTYKDEWWTEHIHLGEARAVFAADDRSGSTVNAGVVDARGPYYGGVGTHGVVVDSFLTYVGGKSINQRVGRYGVTLEARFISEVLEMGEKAINENNKIINISLNLNCWVEDDSVLGGYRKCDWDKDKEKEKLLDTQQRFRTRLSPLLVHARNNGALVFLAGGNNYINRDDKLLMDSLLRANLITALPTVSNMGDSGNDIETVAITSGFNALTAESGVLIEDDDLQREFTTLVDGLAGVLTRISGAPEGSNIFKRIRDIFRRIEDSLKKILYSRIWEQVLSAQEAYSAWSANGVIVAASDSSDRIADFSNVGKTTDLVAPGDNVGVPSIYNSAYRHQRGTSFASPIAAGVASLVAATNPELSPRQIKAILRVTSDEGITERVTEQKYELINAHDAVRCAMELRRDPVVVDRSNLRDILRNLSREIEKRLRGRAEPIECDTGLDVVLLVDVSGSYRDDLPIFKTRARQLVEDLQKLPEDIRLGVASFRNTTYELNQRLTYDSEQVMRAIDSLNASGDEEHLPALQSIAEMETGWEQGRHKLVILFTDEPIDDPSYPSHISDVLERGEWPNLIDTLQNQEIRIVVVWSGNISYDTLLDLAGQVNPPSYSTFSQLYGLDKEGRGNVEVIINAIQQLLVAEREGSDLNADNSGSMTALRPLPRADDYGDTPDMATPIDIGSSLEGELTLKSERAGDLDYFSVEVTETVTLAFYTSGSIVTMGRLLESDGTSVIHATSFDGIDRNFMIEQELDPGTYYLEVSEVSGAAGAYTLYVSERIFEMDDHGDTRGTATPIDIGSSLEGELTVKSGGLQDIDYFSVEVTETVNLAFYTAGSIVTFGQLFESDGTLVASDIYGINYPNFRIEQELDPGTYYLEVSPDFYGIGGVYTIYVSKRAFEMDDHGDTPGTATDIGIGSSLEGALTLKSGGAGDLDYFSVKVTETVRLAFYTSGSIDTVGSLLDSNGISEIDYDDDDGEDFNFRIEQELDPGTYYIEVRPYDEFAEGVYTLYVERSR